MQTKNYIGKIIGYTPQSSCSASVSKEDSNKQYSTLEKELVTPLTKEDKKELRGIFKN